MGLAGRRPSPDFGARALQFAHAVSDGSPPMWVRWKRFRGFLDTRWVEIRPLTVLIGPNNTGKTTLYEPLLLLGQTRKSHTADAQLVTRGPLFDAGRFRDIAFLQSTEDPIRFSFKGVAEEGSVPAWIRRRLTARLN